MLILSGYYFFGRQFVLLWAGNEYNESYMVGLLLLIPVTIPLIQNLGIEIQRAKNKHKIRSLVYLVIAISNVIISIPLIRLFGSTGAALGTAITMILGNGIFMNLYYHKKLSINIIVFWKEILKATKGIIPPVVICYIITRCYDINTWPSLILFVSIYTILYTVSVWFFSFNLYEKNLVIGKVKRGK